MNTNTNNPSDTGQQDVDTVLKDSGVEIIEPVEQSVPLVSTPQPIQTKESVMVSKDEIGTERLEKEFEAEFGPKKEPVGTINPFDDSLRRLKEAKAHLHEQKKKLELETEHDMEMLKKTKSIIEQKIDRLKELEKADQKLDSDIERTETLRSEEKQIEQDIVNINKDVSNTA